MAAAKPAYDPIISVEGMYKGSLTRLGYFFKDPETYGDATLAVLRETAKRYDDALDDCLIQILEAKWLLEHQLAQNRARRAREAAEYEVASNKRILESATQGFSVDPHTQPNEDKPAKRIKIEQDSGDPPMPAQEFHEEPTQTEKAQSWEKDQKIEAKHIDGDKLATATADETASEPREPDQKASMAAEVRGKKGKEAVKISQSQTVGPAVHDTGLHEQPDQTVSYGDMIFESMFGDANAGNEQTNELNYDLDLNPDSVKVSNGFDPTSHNTRNLELLPGLESYANASGDDFNMLNLPAASTVDQAGTSVVLNNNSFDLPEIQGETNFNELFADGDFGGDASLMELDLEDGFFNT